MNKTKGCLIANFATVPDRVINLARRLPQPAIHDLLRALILPIQADYLLAVGTEGQDARPVMNEREFFFTKIIWAMD
ncbi:hypothetical protein ACJ0H5_23370 [Salmonella enterica]|uniref:hypothetical protein n=1 Tax=Salmonella enterica TaxID=28901 RepID=UPI0038839E10